MTEPSEVNGVTIWYDEQYGIWLSGIHEVDIEPHQSMQKAVDYILAGGYDYHD